MINNIRDLGGIPAQDGKIVRRGVFARSALLNNVTAEDYDLLHNKLGVRLVIDLRTDEEAVKKPDNDLPGIAYFHVPTMREPNGDSGAPSMGEIKRRIAAAPDEDTKIALIPNMPHFYERMLTDSFSSTNYAMCVRQLCRFTDGCALFHCSSGKDRTGMIAAGLLLVLGVSREEIVKDYMKSRESSECEAKALYDEAIANGSSERFARAFSDFVIIREEYINAFLDKAEHMCGSLDAFGEIIIGLSSEEIEAFRKRALCERLR